MFGLLAPGFLEVTVVFLLETTGNYDGNMGVSKNRGKTRDFWRLPVTFFFFGKLLGNYDGNMGGNPKIEVQYPKKDGLYNGKPS